MKRFLTIALLLALAGCSFKAHHQAHESAKIGKLDSALEEQSKQYTTAIVDVLSENRQTNQFTQTALKLARADQEIEGMPITRLDTAPLIAGETTALASFEEQLKENRALLQDRAGLLDQLNQTRDKLVEMGTKYEQEKNKHIIRRIWEWGTATLGLGGIIALCVFCPALIPLLLSFVGWVVGKVPSLIGFFQVIGKKSFDAVVKGVGDVRATLKAAHAVAPDKTYTPKEVLAMIDTSLDKAAIDTSHTNVVDARRAVVGAVAQA